MFLDSKTCIIVNSKCLDIVENGEPGPRTHSHLTNLAQSYQLVHNG